MGAQIILLSVECATSPTSRHWRHTGRLRAPHTMTLITLWRSACMKGIW
jgi:hypothetical protein